MASGLFLGLTGLGSCVGCNSGRVSLGLGCVGLLGAAAAAAVGVVAFSGENRDGGRVLWGTSSGVDCID